MVETVDLSWDNLRHRAGVIATKIGEEFPYTTQSDDFLKIHGIPRGGAPAALLVQVALFSRSIRCTLIDKAEEADVIIDDIIDSGKTWNRIKAKVGDKPFYALVDRKEEKTRDWFVFPWEREAEEVPAEDKVLRILQAIGEDPQREGLRDTPRRVVKTWDKLFGGYKQNPKDLVKIFTEGACDQIIVLKDVEFYSTCEHHMLPFFGKAHIGYLPDKKVIGVSKLARLLEVFARRLQIQERIGQQVTDTLMSLVEPLGCGCVLEAQHFCMTSRGVEKQDSVMITSSMQGSFLKDPNVKSEFLRLAGL